MKYSLAFHIIGIVFWIGSLALLTRVMGVVVKGDGRNDAIAHAVKRIWFGFGVSGFVIALLSGLHQVGAGGAALYMQQGWFHAKLGALTVLIVLTLLVTKEVKQFVAGGEVSAKKLGMLHGMSSLMLVIIVFATYLGR